MNISQEILVLDFGDEKREFFKADPSADFAKGKLCLHKLAKLYVTLIFLYLLHPNFRSLFRTTFSLSLSLSPLLHLSIPHPLFHFLCRSLPFLRYR